MCATSIIASGITKVYYIEPYTKSLALKLHESQVDFEPEYIPSNGSDELKRVTFIPFEGVSPRQYIQFFKLNKNRKNDEGIKLETEDLKAKPANIQMLDSYFVFEKKVVDASAEIFDD